MFERLRKAFAGRDSDGPEAMATNADVARWAATQRLAIVPHRAEGCFDLSDELHDFPWRMESGPSMREYIRGLELRGRADVEADPDAAVMVLSRPLRDALAQQVALSGAGDAPPSLSQPEELRWLSLYDEVSWPSLPASFETSFAVIAERVDQAQRWITPAVVSQLLHVVEAQGRAGSQTPLLLLLSQGHVYLRTERCRKSLAEVGHATKALLTAAKAAQALRLPALESA